MIFSTSNKQLNNKSFNWIIHEDFPHDVDDFTQELETIVEE